MEKSLKIKVYPYKKMAGILLNATKISPSDEKILYVVCGPSGSGKSTIMANLYKANKINVPFINFATLKRSGTETPLEQVLKDKISEGKGFAFEWDSSSKEILRLLKYAKDNDFKIKTYFVFTTSASVNELRAEIRHKQGGETYDHEEISENYRNTLPLSKSLKKISDEFVLIDSTFIKGAPIPEF